MSKRRATQPAPAVVHLIIESDSGSDQITIRGGRADYIRATKIVNKLNEWEVDSRVRSELAYRETDQFKDWYPNGKRLMPREYHHQPYSVETVDVR